MRDSAATIIFEPFRLDCARRVLTRDGVPVPLPAKVMTLLLALVERRGEVVTKRELIRRLWPDTVGTEANLSVNVTFLRRKLGEKPRDRRYVVTVPGQGYRFVAAVHPGGPDPRPGVPREGAWRIAVIPFRVVGPGDAEASALAREMEKSIGAALARDPRITVEGGGADSPAPFEVADPLRRARSLGADVFVEGSITAGPVGFRLSIQVVGAGDGTVLRAQAYSVRPDRLLRVRNLVTEEVLRSLGLGPGRSPSSLTRGRDPEAFQLYLEGSLHLSDLDPGSLARARDCFQAAIVRDPGFPRAHVGLAAVHFHLWWAGAEPGPEAIEILEASAHRALALDPDLSDAQVWLANAALFHDHDLDEAGRRFRIALDSPGAGALAHRYHAYYLATCGRWEEARESAQRALDLDPQGLEAHTLAATVLYLERRYTEALAHLRAVSAVSPRFTWAGFLVGWTLIALGDFRGACEHYRALRDTEVDGPWLSCLEAFCLARLGHYGEALRHAEVVRKNADQVTPLNHAVLGLGLYDFEYALRWLELSRDAHEGFIPFLGIDPFWDPLRRHPRFRALQIGPRSAQS